MIAVGCCIGPGNRFSRIAGPALRRVLDPEDALHTITDASGICAAYNSVLEQAWAEGECRAVVLVHDDLELLDGARAVVAEAAAEPGVGLIGIAGGRDLAWGKWWSGRFVAGRVNDSRGERTIGPVRADVDAVDGCLLVITPAAAHLRFDESTFPAFHGYDVDFSLAVRQAGLRVVTRDLPYRHHDKQSTGDNDAFEAAMRALENKWPGWIRPLSVSERFSRRLRRAVSARL